jgi:hypothetical protein
LQLSHSAASVAALSFLLSLFFPCIQREAIWEKHRKWKWIGWHSIMFETFLIHVFRILGSNLSLCMLYWPRYIAFLFSFHLGRDYIISNPVHCPTTRAPPQLVAVMSQIHKIHILLPYSVSTCAHEFSVGSSPQVSLSKFLMCTVLPFSSILILSSRV